MLRRLYDTERQRIANFTAMDGNGGDFLHPVFGDGDESSRIMFIGEAPGAEEAEQGRPFVGKAGKQLDELLCKAKVKRESVYVTNAVKFRPTQPGMRDVRNRTPSQEEIRDGAMLLAHEIAVVKPRIIATLGNTPLKAIGIIYAQTLPTIGVAHGSPLRLKNSNICLFPLYHPASVIYKQELLPVLERDILCLAKLIATTDDKDDFETDVESNALN